MPSEGGKVFISVPDGPSVLAAGGPCSHCGRSGRETTSCVAGVLTPRPQPLVFWQLDCKMTFPRWNEKGKNRTLPSTGLLLQIRLGESVDWCVSLFILFPARASLKANIPRTGLRKFHKNKNRRCNSEKDVFFLLKIFYNGILILKSKKQTKSYFFLHKWKPL